MSIRQKLLGSIGFCLLALLTFAWLAWDTIETTKVTGAKYHQIVLDKDLIADILPPPEYILESYLLVHQMEDLTTADQQADFRKRLKALRKDFDDRHAYWEQNLAPGPMRDRFLRDAYTPAKKFLTVVEEGFLPALAAGKSAEVRQILREQLAPEYEKHRAAIDDVVTMANESLAKTEGEVGGLVRQRGMILLILAIAMVLGVGVMVVLVNHITKKLGDRLQRASEFAAAIAEGNMTTSIEQGPADEIGRLLRALSDMRDNMRDMVSGIRQGVETLVGASSDLSTVSKQTSVNVEDLDRHASAVVRQAETSCQHTEGIAGGISESSRNLESVAMATQEMSSTVDGIASDSAKARSISDEAQAQAEAAHAVMGDLENAAKRIGQVSETIRSISAQTSLLALNATIEAARAGAAGKGFAVVANEVKDLSRQAAEATQDINDKVTSVQNSTNQALGDIEKISTVVKDMNQLITSIAAAVEEQSVVTRNVAGNIGGASSGIHAASERINESAEVSRSIASEVSGIHATIQKIRADGESVRGRAEDLSSLAVSLSRSISRFSA